MIRKLIVILLAVLLVLSCAIFVACDNNTAQTGELQYALTEDNTGYVVVDSSSVSGAVVVPDSYLDLPVVGISDLALSKSSITSIVIPDSIAYIGNSAFWQCGSLTSVTIGNSVSTIGDYAFMDCTKLEKLTLGTSIISIGQLAFYGCNNLNAVYIVGGLDSWLNIDFGNISANPMYYTSNVYLGANSTSIKLCDITEVVTSSSTTAIHNYAFYGCESILSVELSSSVTTIDDSAFANITTLESVDFGSGTTHIGSSAFYCCSSLTTISLPDSVTTLGEKVFMGCSSLSSVTLSNNLTNISEDAFCDCVALSSIDIPDSVIQVGTYAFKDCFDLVAVTLGDNVETIGNSAFDGCTSLDIVTIGSSVSAIEDSAFGDTNIDSVYYNGTVAGWCGIQFESQYSNPISNGATWFVLDDSGNYQAVSDLIVPEGVTTINAYAFYSCNQLTNVTIGNDVVDICDYAFDFCTYIEFLTLGDSVDSIGQLTFGYCNNIASVVLPSSVSQLGEKSFYACKGIVSLQLNNGLVSIGRSSFSWTDIATVTIPATVQSIGDNVFGGCDCLICIYVADDNEYYSSIDGNLYNKDGSALYEYAIASTSTTFTVSSNIVSLSSRTFRQAKFLQEFVVEEGNTSYCTVDGVLYSSDMTTLVCYPYGSDSTTYTVPDGVQVIGEYAFIETKLTEVILADTVTTIGNWAFYNMPNLTDIYLGSSLQTVGGSVFTKCDKLTEIVLPASLTQLNCQTLYDCTKLTSITFEDTDNWYVTTSSSYKGGMAIDVSDALLNAVYFASCSGDGDKYYMYKVVE